MKNFRNLIATIFAVIFFNNGINAMNLDTQSESGSRSLAASIAEKYVQYEMIDPALLAAMIQKVPEQCNTWACGLHQCGHSFACADKIKHIDTKRDIDYQNPKDYPLAIDVSLGFLPQLIDTLRSFGLLIDDSGAVRIGAAPHELARFINSHLPQDFPLRAKAVSASSMSLEDLIKSVRSNMKNNMPTIAYYVVDKTKKMMHDYAIVGISRDSDDPEFLVLDTKGQGVARLKVMNATQFLNNMNADSIVSMVKDLDRIAGTTLRGFILFNGGRVIAPELLNRWQAFSYVSFVNADEVEENVSDGGPSSSSNQNCVLQ